MAGEEREVVQKLTLDASEAEATIARLNKAIEDLNKKMARGGSGGGGDVGAGTSGNITPSTGATQAAGAVNSGQQKLFTATDGTQFYMDAKGRAVPYSGTPVQGGAVTGATNASGFAGSQDQREIRDNMRWAAMEANAGYRAGASLDRQRASANVSDTVFYERWGLGEINKDDAASARAAASSSRAIGSLDRQRASAYMRDMGNLSRFNTGTAQDLLGEYSDINKSAMGAVKGYNAEMMSGVKSSNADFIASTLAFEKELDGSRKGAKVGQQIGRYLMFREGLSGIQNIGQNLINNAAIGRDTQSYDYATGTATMIGMAAGAPLGIPGMVVGGMIGSTAGALYQNYATMREKEIYSSQAMASATGMSIGAVNTVMSGRSAVERNGALGLATAMYEGMSGQQAVALSAEVTGNIRTRLGGADPSHQYANEVIDAVKGATNASTAGWFKEAYSSSRASYMYETGGPLAAQGYLTATGTTSHYDKAKADSNLGFWDVSNNWSIVWNGVLGRNRDKANALKGQLGDVTDTVADTVAGIGASAGAIFQANTALAASAGEYATAAGASGIDAAGNTSMSTRRGSVLNAAGKAGQVVADANAARAAYLAAHTTDRGDSLVKAQIEKYNTAVNTASTELAAQETTARNLGMESMTLSAGVTAAYGATESGIAVASYRGFGNPYAGTLRGIRSRREAAQNIINTSNRDEDISSAQRELAGLDLEEFTANKNARFIGGAAAISSSSAFVASETAGASVNLLNDIDPVAGARSRYRAAASHTKLVNDAKLDYEKKAAVGSGASSFEIDAANTKYKNEWATQQNLYASASRMQMQPNQEAFFATEQAKYNSQMRSVGGPESLTTINEMQAGWGRMEGYARGVYDQSDKGVYATSMLKKTIAGITDERTRLNAVYASNSGITLDTQMGLQEAQFQKNLLFASPFERGNRFQAVAGLIGNIEKSIAEAKAKPLTPGDKAGAMQQRELINSLSVDLASEKLELEAGFLSRISAFAYNSPSSQGSPISNRDYLRYNPMNRLFGNTTGARYADAYSTKAGSTAALQPGNATAQIDKVQIEITIPQFNAIFGQVKATVKGDMGNRRLFEKGPAG